MVRRRPCAPDAPSTGGRTAVASATEKLSRLRPGPGRKEYQASANFRGWLETCRPPLAGLAQHDALAGQRVLPLQRDMTAVVGEQELAQRAGAGAAQGVAVAGGVTEKISLSSTDLPPPFSRKSTPAGAGRRSGPTGSSSKNSAWVGAGSGTGSPTPLRSRTVSA